MRRALAAVTLALAASAAAAAQYPLRPVRLIVPLAPGGGADIASRALARALSERLGQQVIVDNRPGAGGNIGAELAAKAPADGHTLIMGTSSTFAVNPTLYRNLPYDAVRDFAPIALVSAAPNLLAVHPGVAAKSVAELLGLARAHPGKLAYASSGIGGSSHLAAELFKLTAKIDLTHVPYKGTGQALPDLIGGNVQLMFASGPALVPHRERLRVLAVAGPSRIAAFENLPTLREAGLPGVESTAWNGMLAPRATPRAIIGALHAHVARIVHSPEMRARLEAQGAQAVGSTPAEFGSYIESEIEKWRRVIRAAGIRIE